MTLKIDDVFNEDSGIQVNDRSIDKNVSVVDADTIYDNQLGQSIRIEGVNSLETSKVLDGQFKAGDVGGDYASDITLDLAKKGGFTKPITTGEVDPYGRAIGDLINPETGQKLSNKLLESGLADITTFSDEGQVSSALAGRLDRLNRLQRGEQSEWDIAKTNLNAIINSTGGPQAKPLALDEAQFAIAPDIFSKAGTQIRDTDRTLDNFYDGGAWGKLKTAFGLGVSGVAEGYYGSFDLISDIFSGEDSNWGQANADRIKREIQDLPILRNQNAFDKDGNWTLDGAGKIIDYVFTNMATSAPYMIQSIIATALAAPTFGASLAFPTLTYTGQVYNEQTDKDAVSAIVSGVGQAALDYFGIRTPGLVANARGLLTDPHLKRTIVAEVAKKHFGGNTAAANAAIGKFTTKQMAALSNVAKDQLAKTIRAKYVGKRAAIAAGVGGLSEGVTETGQEFLAALGEKNFDVNNLDKRELTNRLMNAAVAGFGLGAVTNVGSPIASTIANADAVSAANSPNADKFTKDLKYRNELVKEGKGYDNLDTYLDEAHANLSAEDNLDKIAKKEGRRRDRADFFTKSRDFLKGGLNQLWEGWGANLNRRFGDKGRYTRALLGLIGGNNVHHGGTLETDQHLAQANLANTVGTEAEALQFFNVRKLKDINDIYQDSAVKDFLSKVINKYDANKKKYKTLQEAAADAGLNLTGKYANIQDKVLTFAQKLDAFDTLQAQYEGKTKEVTGIINSKTIDKAILRKNQREFIDNAVKKGMSREEATALSNELLDLPNVSDVTDVADDFLRLKPSGTSKVTLNEIAKDPANAKFFNTDLFYNIAAKAGTASAKLANSRYAGKNGQVFAHLINKAVKAGEISKTEASFLAQEFKDIMDVRSGEYKKIESPTWRTINNHLMFWSTLNALPLAQTASIVELALVTRTTNKKSIFNVLVPFAKEAGRELLSEVNAAGSRVTGGRIQRKAYEGGGRAQTIKLGYTAESQSQLRRHDISVGETQQKWLNAFFRATGLQGITNITRSMRLSLAGDAIRGWVDDVAFEGTTGPTQASIEAREALINLGVDVEFMVNQHKSGAPMTETEKAHFESNLQRAMYNFTNDAVANPTKTNRPKFYQNPRTRLFFQFQGFLATLTANILPKMYRQVVTGTVGTRINALTTIGTLLFLGFLSSWLKDQIKYGKETPYLDDWGKFQRAVGASGLLGTGERLLNIVHPLYPQKHDNWVELALDAIQSEAPALGYAGKIVDLSAAIYEGEPGKIGKKTFKAAPGLGPVNQIANAVEDLLE